LPEKEAPYLVYPIFKKKKKRVSESKFLFFCKPEKIYQTIKRVTLLWCAFCFVGESLAEIESLVGIQEFMIILKKLKITSMGIPKKAEPLSPR
jgi:hypothetical protein